MERGLYIAAGGMLAEQVRQDQIANDLANASTPGYKPDRAAQASFGEMMLQNRGTGQTIGTLSLGVRIDELRTDLTQGALRQTGNPLDLALSGDGFLAVQTPQGVRYTRDGQLTMDAQGRLQTTTGFLVLGTDGKPITVGDPNTVSVGADGTVRSGTKKLGQIDVVSLTGAVKQGDTLFSGKPGAKPANTQIEQGYIEGSGVEPARAMVDMIVSLRAYEASQRVLHTIDDTLGRAVTQVGSATGN
jgi:flagellar basal-body rod protein FlgG